MCRERGLCTMEKERYGARGGARSSKIGFAEWEANRRPLSGGRVGSSVQSLKRPSVPVEPMRFGWRVGGSHCSFEVLVS